MTDVTVQLPSGATARVRDFIVFRGHHGCTLTVVVQSPMPVRDDAAATARAQELATLHDAFARAHGADRIAINICESDDCVAAKAPAAMIYYFRRDASEAWLPDEVIVRPQLPDRGASA